MNNKQRVNIQARINRHLRILKQNVWFESKTFNWWKISNSFTLAMIFIIIIFPVYPSISNIVYTNTELEFDRWFIDESSILSSYDWIENRDESHLVEHIDSYVSVNTILNDNRDLSWVNEITRYEVRPWDSIASIAEKLWVSKNTVLWANGMEYARELKVWEIIRVPSATWYLYKVKFGDKIEKIAEEYNISVESIEKQNWIQNGYLIAWREILLPWASKKIPVVEKPKPVQKETPKVNSNNNKQQNKKIENKPNTNKQKNNWNSWSWWKSEFTNSSWAYNLVWRKPQWRFAWWNCTWYVAQYKNVNWWWNANQWLRNARAKWHATWNTPQTWAIVQFWWRWYNPTYGHVWIVVNVTWSHIIVSDMNYRRINEVTVRKVPIWDASIQWYIYVK